MFEKGNEYYKRRLTNGAPRKYETPSDLAEACASYLEWVAANPVQGDKMRAMTIVGLCIHLEISKETWYAWKESRPDLSDIMNTIEGVIYEQKFTGAAAGVLNHHIIARELGLVDKKSNEHSGSVALSDQSDESINDAIRRLMSQMSPEEIRDLINE